MQLIAPGFGIQAPDEVKVGGEIWFPVVPVTGLKITTGCPMAAPELYVVSEKSPFRSAGVGTVEN